jgi:uncharacterized SAM-binding protein YcdF (DUF218 family)
MYRIGLIFLIFFSNMFIANEAMSAWEIKPLKYSEVKDYDIGIVLCGVTNYRDNTYDRVNFEKGADRVLHTIQLYKLGKIKKILIAGISEAEYLAKVFLLCGIPEQDLILESKSLNTHEDALFSKELLDQKNLKGKYLLITSAYHMRRASLCFDKAGLKTDVFTVDFNSEPRNFSPVNFLIPLGDALYKWRIIFHEIFGIITYKIMGYI